MHEPDEATDLYRARFEGDGQVTTDWVHRKATDSARQSCFQCTLKPAGCHLWLLHQVSAPMKAQHVVDIDPTLP